MKGILEELLPVADKIILTKSRVPERAAEPEKIKEFIASNYKDISLTQNLEEAIGEARSAAGKDDLILITGSLFVVGEARQIIYPAAQHHGL